MSAGNDRPIRTFIYGSCVSRDTFEFLRPLGYELVGYVARQSLISAYSRVDAPLPKLTLDSAFQRRMVDLDWSSSLVPQLRRSARHIDLLVWDLFDERLGVRKLDTGVITRSVEGISSGLDEILAPTTRWLDLGSHEHWRLWRRRLDNFADALESLGLLERLVLLAPPWAEYSSSGSSAPSSFGRAPHDANALFAPYYAAAASIAPSVVSMPLHEVRSDASHRWGEAPFHYIPANYQEMAGQIDAIARADVTPRSRAGGPRAPRRDR